MEPEKGQSLIEVIVAMGIFVLVVSALAGMVIGTYNSDRLGKEETVATLLAQEGLEAVKSIRDNNFSDLSAGTYGLAIENNHWTFNGAGDDVSGWLSGGSREVVIENISEDKKKVTSKVNWDFNSSRPQGLKLVTYFTNWQEATTTDPGDGGYASCDEYCADNGYSGGICRSNSNKCDQNGETYEPVGDAYCSGTGGQKNCCCQ